MRVTRISDARTIRWVYHARRARNSACGHATAYVRRSGARAVLLQAAVGPIPEWTCDRSDVLEMVTGLVHLRLRSGRGAKQSHLGVPYMNTVNSEAAFRFPGRVRR